MSYNHTLTFMKFLLQIENGQEVGILGPGSHFGDVCLIAPPRSLLSKRTASVLAKRITDVQVLHKVDFDRLVHHYPKVQQMMAQSMSTHVFSTGDSGKQSKALLENIAAGKKKSGGVGSSAGESSSGAMITRDAIRNAMLRLATNDQFLDAVASELNR